LLTNFGLLLINFGRFLRKKRAKTIE